MNKKIYCQFFRDLKDFGEILEYQKSMRDSVLAGERDEGVVLFLSHKPVYTLGIRGKTDNILVDEKFMEQEGISQYKIRRGGDVTYHGPGQLVIYPIVHIKRLGFESIKQFVIWWSEGIAEILREKYKIEGAVWDEQRTGIWVGNKKIMAVGLHFRQFVPIHGFALNISPEMSHFDGIVPCGITDGGVTSIAAETGVSPSLPELVGEIINYMKGSLKNTYIEELEEL